MTSIAQLAAENGAQPYELAAYLGLGADYDSNAVLDEATEAVYRGIIDAAWKQDS